MRLSYRLRSGRRVKSAWSNVVFVPTLLWPLAQTWTTPLSVRWQATASIALIAFAAFFSSVSVLLNHRRPWMSVPLLILAGLATPGAGFSAIVMHPFVTATWIFVDSLAVACVGTAAVTVAMIAIIVMWVPDAMGQGLVWIILFSLAGMFFIRFMRDAQHRAHDLAAAQALAEQREDMARIVHDSLGQALTAVTVRAQLARRLIGSQDDAARSEIDAVLDVAREALHEVRTTAELLEAPDFAGQLARTREIICAAGMTACWPDHVPSLPPETDRLFAACLREAVTNVVRHSGAHTCTVEVAPQRLRIIDDGVGIDNTAGGIHDEVSGDQKNTVSPPARGGKGLRSLKERVAAAGGHCTVLPVTAASSAHSTEHGTVVDIVMSAGSDNDNAPLTRGRQRHKHEARGRHNDK